MTAGRGFPATRLIVEGLRARVADPALRKREIAERRTKAPMRRHGEAREVAAVAVFVASGDVRCISGAIIDVGGALNEAKL